MVTCLYKKSKSCQKFRILLSLLKKRKVYFASVASFLVASIAVRSYLMQSSKFCMKKCFRKIGFGNHVHLMLKWPQNIKKIGPDFVLIFEEKVLNSVLIFFKNRWQRCNVCLH